MVNLDILREKIAAHVLSLWREDDRGGGFTMGDEDRINLASTTDVVWILYALGETGRFAGKEDAIAAWLNSAANPQTGRIRHDWPFDNPAVRGCDGHALWQTVRALNIIGRRLERFPEHFEPLLTPEGMQKWFNSYAWHHHEVLGIVPVIASTGDPELTKVYYSSIQAKQDPVLGTWTRGGKTNVSRTFGLTALHMAAGLVPPMPEKIILGIISEQTELGIWGTPPPPIHFGTMDSTYILHRVGDAAGLPAEPRMSALRRLADFMDSYISTLDISKEINTHPLIATTHTMGLLAEVFPERYIQTRPWYFDWDRAPLFYCDVVKERYDKVRGK